MSELDTIYRQHLQVGFLVLRQAMESGDAPWIYAELELLHNLPSLLGEENPERHHYFWDEERPHYVKWVTTQGSEQARSRMRTYYEPIWEELREAISPLPKT